MQNIPLYELVTDLIDLTEEGEMELNEDVKQEVIKLLEIEIKNKSKNIIGVIKNHEATIKAMKDEEKRIAKNRKIKENSLERFKEYVRECLERAGKKKVETDIGVISLRKKQASLIIEDEELIPEEYKVRKELVSIDKNSIKDFIKKGNTVNGCKLSDESYSLMIR
ncbi:bacteriophage resistance protein,Siphovirus Gp157 [[Clostridium] sordellii]|uniref:siphovirus Gp157 family protein n=1 Tax=Paraclostridium sordellii TaxID=1505 RepID=UPI00054290C3|nr:siphovirus Gp157 family protein [Paeniclostridium sordellii]CEK35429.1 bacteriophage resistance protein,Siphovirus Gp157 [[Clostridium] sordellii] [Paeniclostridium sordellii]